jgi:hypothetical protein
MMRTESAAILDEGFRTIVREEIMAALRAFLAQDAFKTDVSRNAVALPTLQGVDPYSLVPFVEHVLREADGGPLHAKVIAERVYALGFQHRWPPKHRDQLTRTINSLASPSQHPETFERVAPRTLQLRRSK